MPFFPSQFTRRVGYDIEFHIVFVSGAFDRVLGAVGRALSRALGAQGVREQDLTRYRDLAQAPFSGHVKALHRGTFLALYNCTVPVGRFT